jgi:pimeloyl-ACP methyl ester carboxylesterase
MNPCFNTLPANRLQHDMARHPIEPMHSPPVTRAYDLLRWCCQAFLVLILLDIGIARVQGDGPADNQVDKVRPVPPPGIVIPEDRRAELRSGLQDLERQIDLLRAMKDSLVDEFLPDVEIFQRALSIALDEDGFFELADVDRAQAVLKEGLSRAEALASQQAPWRKLFAHQFATVRGFRSKIDGTAQPYGVVMNNFPPEGSKRADVWCRGRSEKGLELQFLAARLKPSEPFPVPGCIMIHPFGRYCNANKLAGEIDTLEAIEHAQREYGIDSDRITIRGFSMGGAAAWHLAVHYPDRWFAANPGAGFSETPDFLKVFQSETLQPYWFEQKLWQLYDCPVWVRNLRMLPTIAYSGALDKQKQAADIMARASWELPDWAVIDLNEPPCPRWPGRIADANFFDEQWQLKSSGPNSSR